MAVPRSQYPDVTKFNDALHAVLDDHRVDLVALLGFLSPFETRGRFDGKTLNVHPALIPAFSGKGFYGDRVHEAVIESGVKITGATGASRGRPVRPRPHRPSRGHCSP